jgi:hypothetical protein
MHEQEESNMDFIKNMYEDGLVEKKLDEDAWADIRARRLDRAEHSRQVALYGYLVGMENALKAVKAAEYAEQGKGIPAQFAKAYAPIMDMIDDIIDAGPAGVQRLRAIHKSLKKR